MISRRSFLELCAPLLGVAGFFRIKPNSPEDALVFRGETISVFNRDGMEIVVEGGSMEYASFLDHHDGYKGLRPFISWDVRAKTFRAYGGHVGARFYGKDAREQAENAARTWVLASRGGWPTFVAPDQLTGKTYGDGGLPIAK